MPTEATSVVQVNFRGSTGYGKAFVNAGDGEWGRQDARRPDRRRPVGRRRGLRRPRSGSASTGAPTAGTRRSSGPTFTPDVFRCAVDIVGPSNLKTLIESIPPYWAPIDRAVPHPRSATRTTDADVPVGALAALTRRQDPDPAADRPGRQRPAREAGGERADRRRDAARRAIRHEYLLFEDEGHGFAKPENRLRFYAAAERFLAEHLGGRFEP